MTEKVSVLSPDQTTQLMVIHRRLERIELHHWPLFDLARNTQVNQVVKRSQYIREDLIKSFTGRLFGSFEMTQRILSDRVDTLEVLCKLLQES